MRHFVYEFYNAGEKIHELMRFSIAGSSQGFNNEGNDKQSCGYWPLVAPERGWFEVPSELPSGNETVRVTFADDIVLHKGRRGIVMLDPDHDPSLEDRDTPLEYYAKAPTRELCEQRGKALWERYTREVVENHLNGCQNALAAGGAPRSAKGFTKHCLELHGITDPGEKYFLGLKEGKTPAAAASPEMHAFMAQAAADRQMMMAIILAVASGEKIDPELLKAMAAKPAEVPQIVPSSVTSGIATGEIRKPLSNEDGWEKSKPNAEGRNARAEKAAKAL